MAGFAFHHIGVACGDIDAEAKQLATIGYAVEGPEFRDSTQGVRGLFLVGARSPRLELLEPLADAPTSVLAPWLRSGTKLYHLAYVVDGLDAAINDLRSARAKLVVPPVPAVAFDGRKIAFLMLPNRLLVELISSE